MQDPFDCFWKLAKLYENKNFPLMIPMQISHTPEILLNRIWICKFVTVQQDTGANERCRPVREALEQ